MYLWSITNSYPGVIAFFLLYEKQNPIWVESKQRQRAVFGDLINFLLPSAMGKNCLSAADFPSELSDHLEPQSISEGNSRTVVLLRVTVLAVGGWQVSVSYPACPGSQRTVKVMNSRHSGKTSLSLASFLAANLFHLCSL